MLDPLIIVNDCYIDVRDVSGIMPHDTRVNSRGTNELGYDIIVGARTIFLPERCMRRTNFIAMWKEIKDTYQTPCVCSCGSTDNKPDLGVCASGLNPQ